MAPGKHPVLVRSPLHGILKTDMTDSAAVTAEVDRAVFKV